MGNVIAFLCPLFLYFALFGGTFSGRIARPGEMRRLKSKATGFVAEMALVIRMPAGKSIATDERKVVRQDLRQRCKSLNPGFKRLDAHLLSGIMAL